MFRGKNGQSTLEYALIIAAVIGALLAINAYMKKGVEGRLKESTDQIGKQFDATEGFSTAWQVQSAGSTVTSETRTSGITTSTVTAAETLTKGEKESWGTAPAQKY